MLTERVSLAKLVGNGLEIAFNDVDLDGWPVALIAKDGESNNLLAIFGTAFRRTRSHNTGIGKEID